MFSVRDVLDQLRVPVVDSHRNVRSGWVGVDCPWCGTGSGKYHLGIHLETGAANCWRCGPKSLYEVLREITGDKAAAWEAARDVRRVRAVRRESPAGGRLVRPRGVGPLARVHRAYLAKRGLNAAYGARVWGLQGIGLEARLAWRIYLPILLHGEEVSWTTRAVGGSGARYVSAGPGEEAVPAKSLLYGEDYCRHAVIVHEGPFDAIRTGPGSVATFGLSWTQAQLAAVAKYPLRAICFDNSEQAQAAARRMARELCPFRGDTVVVRLESGEDPGSADPEETAELRRKFLGNSWE